MQINLDTKNFREALTVYLEVIQRFHKLADKEIEVAVELVITYMYYLKRYGSPQAAVKLYTEKESRKAMVANLGFNDQTFRNYLTKLKNKNVLKPDMSISKAFLPDIETNADGVEYINLTLNLSYAQEEHNQG